MKWMLCLLIGMLVASPAVGQMTGEEAGQMSAADARILAELQKMNGELAALKADMAEVKTELAELKTEVAVVKAEVKGLKEYVDVKIAATTAEIRAVNRRLTFVEYLLLALVTAHVTVLLWMLKKQWDERRSDRGKMDAQEKEIATQQAEIIALRAENERMKNASGLVSSSGGRLESE